MTRRTIGEIVAADLAAREAVVSRPIEEPADPAARVLDDLSREWARKNNGTWAALGTAVTVDSFAELAAKYGVREVLS